MPVQGPWYITHAAVEQYMKLCGWPDDDEHFDRAEDALLAMARESTLVREQENGFHLYRGPKPNRLRLVVNPKPRTEGDLPQLVQVLGEHDGVKRIQHAALMKSITMPKLEAERLAAWHAAARKEGFQGNVQEWIISVCDSAAARMNPK